MLKYILIILLVGMTANAALVNMDTVTFPYSYTSHSGDTWDTLDFNANYTSTSSQGGASLSIQVARVVVKGDNFSLTYNTGNVSGTGAGGHEFYPSLTVIGVALRADSIYVQNLKIIQNDSAIMNVGINVGWTGSVVGCQITGCQVTQKGGQSLGLYCSAPKNLKIYGCNFYNQVTHYPDRQYSDANPIRCDVNGGDFAGKLYNVMIQRCSTFTNPHMGIEASGLVFIDSNYCSGDGRNDLFPLEDTLTCGDYESWENNYQILADDITAGSRISYNTIRSDSNYFGCVGLNPAGEGTVDSPIVVHNNDVRVQSGPSCNLRWGHRTYAYRQRYSNRNIHVYNNTFIVYVDSSNTTTHRSRYGYAAFLSAEDYGTSNARHADSNYFYNNHCEVVFVGDAGAGGGINSVGVVMEWADNNAPYANGNNVLENNYIKAFLPMAFGGSNNAANSITSINDSLAFPTPLLANTGSYYNNRNAYITVGYDNRPCTANIIVNPVFLPSMDTSYISDSVKWVGTGSNMWFTLKRDINLTVDDLNGDTVVGATVYVINAYNDTVLNTTTNSVGQATVRASFHYNNYTGADSLYTNFENFTLQAKYGSDSTRTTTFKLSDRNGSADTTLVLSATDINPNPATKLKGIK